MRKGVMASVGALGPSPVALPVGSAARDFLVNDHGGVQRNPRHFWGPEPSRSLQQHAQRCEAEGSPGLVTEKPGRTEVHTVGSCVTARTWSSRRLITEINAMRCMIRCHVCDSKYPYAMTAFYGVKVVCMKHLVYGQGVDSGGRVMNQVTQIVHRSLVHFPPYKLHGPIPKPRKKPS